tara:strand:+ start:359 stop:805 length:447 start_codon:yes stop_codon:yes gene_type:complete
MHKIKVENIGGEYLVACPSCNHSMSLSHTSWSAIICLGCGVELHQEKEEEMKPKSPVKLPFVIIADSEKEKMTIMAPTDALNWLNANQKNESIKWVHEGELEISMQKLIDILICHPDFFPCLDVAIDSDPRDRQLKRLLLRAKKQPEN